MPHVFQWKEAAVAETEMFCNNDKQTQYKDIIHHWLLSFHKKHRGTCKKTLTEVTLILPSFQIFMNFMAQLCPVCF